jgi:hypothetical protein
MTVAQQQLVFLLRRLIVWWNTSLVYGRKFILQSRVLWNVGMEQY